MADNVHSSLYEQIKHYIRSEIDRQFWKPGDLLPSENELTKRFSVSRITAKKAMSDLVKEGLVYRIQGKGSYVNFKDVKDGRTQMNAGPEASPVKPPVALLLPFMNNLFNALLLNGVESMLAEAGYPLLFCNTGNSQEKEERIIRNMKAMNLSGMIIYPVEGESYNREILQLTLDAFPLVVMDRYLRGIDTNFVCSDNARGAQEAVEHLLALGHRNIGFVSTTIAGTSSIEDRLMGYERALAERRIPIDHRLRLTNLEIEVPKKEEIRSFLERNSDMTAVFAINPGLGLEILQTAEEMGIRVPRDLSLVFFDDFEFSGFHYLKPTCVSQEERKLGQEAARLLISIMENPHRERRKLFLPPTLMIRETTARPGRLQG